MHAKIYLFLTPCFVDLSVVVNATPCIVAGLHVAGVWTEASPLRDYRSRLLAHAHNNGKTPRRQGYIPLYVGTPFIGSSAPSDANP